MRTKKKEEMGQFDDQKSNSDAKSETHCRSDENGNAYQNVEATWEYDNQMDGTDDFEVNRGTTMSAKTKKWKTKVGWLRRAGQRMRGQMRSRSWKAWSCRISERVVGVATQRRKSEVPNKFDRAEHG